MRGGNASYSTLRRDSKYTGMELLLHDSEIIIAHQFRGLTENSRPIMLDITWSHTNLCLLLWNVQIMRSTALTAGFLCSFCSCHFSAGRYLKKKEKYNYKCWWKILLAVFLFAHVLDGFVCSIKCLLLASFELLMHKEKGRRGFILVCWV